MSRNDELYLQDILKAIKRIHHYTSHLDKEQFKTDDMCVDSVLFNLMTIGESVKNIPDEIRQQAPHIRWRDIGRFRDRIVHHYFELDIDIIWEIITIHLTPLETHVENLLQEPSDED